jgi:drug/metabolite transporter (DMT)-like permease
MLQNAGIERTSVSHAALVVGTVPVLVALIAAGLGEGQARPRAWSGYGVALLGIALVAGSGGGGATALGDLLVLSSAALSATFIVFQPRLLAERDPASVTAVQLLAGAFAAAPVALLSGSAPHAHPDAAALAALIALSLAGTLLPFWLFAYGQAKVPAALAGPYLNLEPVVGAAVGWTAFGDAASAMQLTGAAAVIAGIILSTLPTRRCRRGERRPDGPRARRPRRRRGCCCEPPGSTCRLPAAHRTFVEEV